MGDRKEVAWSVKQKGLYIKTATAPVSFRFSSSQVCDELNCNTLCDYIIEVEKSSKLNTFG